MNRLDKLMAFLRSSRAAVSYHISYETNDSFDFPVSLSIGSAYWRPEGSESLEEALAKADQRMYEDKRKQTAVAQPD